MSDETLRLEKYGYTINLSHELAEGGTDNAKAIWRDRSRLWLFSRRITVWVVAKLQAFAVRHEFMERDACYECGGELIPTTDVDYIAGWEGSDE